MLSSHLFLLAYVTIPWCFQAYLIVSINFLEVFIELTQPNNSRYELMQHRAPINETQ